MNEPNEYSIMMTTIVIEARVATLYKIIVGCGALLKHLSVKSNFLLIMYIMDAAFSILSTFIKSAIW